MEKGNSISPITLKSYIVAIANPWQRMEDPWQYGSPTFGRPPRSGERGRILPMNHQKTFTIAGLMFFTFVTSIAVVAWLKINTTYIAIEVPRPNSGTYSTAEAQRLLPANLKKAKRISAGHAFIENWKGPTQSIRVHVTRRGKIETTDFFGNKQTGMTGLQKSISNVPIYGNALSVLLTSDSDGWDDSNLKRAVAKTLFVPSIQIYLVDKELNFGRQGSRK